MGKTFVHLIDRAERRVEAGSGEEELLAEIEAWFDSGMDQVSGWYRRHTQKALLLLGLGLAAIFNVDALRITSELYRSPALRADAVAAAELMNALPEASEDPTVQQATAEFAEAVARMQGELSTAGIPMGWAGIAVLPPSQGSGVADTGDLRFWASSGPGGSRRS